MTKRAFVKGKHSPKDASALSVWKDKYNDGDISFEQFKILSQLNCFYCNSKPSNLTNFYRKIEQSSSLRIKEGDFIYSGLDRVDNSKPHLIDNVVPCCIHCNFAKGNQSIFEFKSKLETICSNINNFSIPNLNGKINISFAGREKAVKLKSLSLNDKIGKLIILSEEKKELYKHQKMVCKCECGSIVSIIKKDILSGKSRSCGSARCKWKHPPIVSAIKRVFRRSKPNNGLTIEQFFELSQMNCIYCGSNPNNIAHAERFVLSEDRFIYNGLDKLFPENGYNIKNVVPCCISCNKIKYTSNIDEFKVWLFNIKNNFLTKNIEYKEFIFSTLDVKNG